MTTEYKSPRWNSTTKLLAGFTLVAIVAFALAKFQGILPPLIMTFLMVYLLYPVANFLKKKLHIKWGLAVALVYISLILLFLALATISGFELVSQVQSLIKIVESSLTELPDLIEQISHNTIALGPLVFEMSALDLNSLSGQLIDGARTMLGRTGELLGTVAGTALNSLAWTAFVLLMSFFILAESGGLPGGILRVDAFEYTADLNRMKKELTNVWNAFLRGQIILVSTAIILYTVVLSILGVRYALGLALLTGAARFLPYVGPAIAWTVMALVAFFQAYKPFGLSDVAYTLIVLAVAWVIDSIFDNLVSPRIMADAIKVHPAEVLVAAIIALDLLGVLGVVIAAPMLATLQLLARYVIRKLFDIDPWDGLLDAPQPQPLREQISNWWNNLRTIWQKLREKIRK
ncbi:MAG: AI-2E family transporter [Anaerolineae bacterium]|nr:AI-2E family transporter [Anaerolineae bacterium]